MARKIRFPLKMNNGAEVRTLDELKENFDLESVLGYFTDGKLSTWLADRYYDEKAAAVSALSADTLDLNAKLCEILEVEYQQEEDVADLEYIQRRNEKYKILSAFTDNRDILDNVDIVAMNQDELFDILNEQPEKVYLYGDKFSIPFGAKDVYYVGINNPKLILDKGKSFFDYDESNIGFINASFDNSVYPLITKGEKLFISGKYKEAFPYIEKSAQKGIYRSMYILHLYYKYGYNTIEVNDNEAKYWSDKAKEINEHELYDIFSMNLKVLADKDDVIAQVNLAKAYSGGIGVEKNADEAFNWYKKAAELNYVEAQNELGDLYYLKNDSREEYLLWKTKAAEQGDASAQYSIANYYYEKDLFTAVEWYKKSAEQGFSSSQYKLGKLYYNGEGFNKDYNKSFYWYTKAAEHGHIFAFLN